MAGILAGNAGWTNDEFLGVHNQFAAWGLP